MTNYENIQLCVEPSCYICAVYLQTWLPVSALPCPGPGARSIFVLGMTAPPVCSWTVQTRVNLLRDTCLDVYNGSTRQLDVTGGDGNMTNSGDWSLGSTEHQEPDRQLAA